MTQVLNFILIFIAITFCFLIATLSYMKAFKVNSKIANSIEKFEGYNEYAKYEIQRNLHTLGYKKGQANDCGVKGVSDIGYDICIRQVGNAKKGKYIRYKITTHIEFGPILGFHVRIPIKSQTEKIYVFS